jgi:hypothetical protein
MPQPQDVAPRQSAALFGTEPTRGAACVLVLSSVVLFVSLAEIVLGDGRNS